MKRKLVGVKIDVEKLRIAKKNAIDFDMTFSQYVELALENTSGLRLQQLKRSVGNAG